MRINHKKKGATFLTTGSVPQNVVSASLLNSSLFTDLYFLFMEISSSTQNENENRGGFIDI